ncbi:4Fe-4S dicluster domain-containing protein [Leptolyngbya sp. CCNP1308]|uniref:4Fe-4S dicluster domain-containing protein n=1 Tax=Leptolyngbya sp. CCNP1308 TaxID=3110255 RepID=UPI002B1ED37F|nr:4Fe-4S dicluster domain-containing protein [Leptolyngbya sp. CCNP1308]MEA5448101.1 4Fe-4S dicluster domain-containing protein [Leptolyngbya sp. CCNP1308]
MPYSITQSCIGCQRCLSACPTQAIQTNGVAFWIEIDRCNQCKGSHGVPQCWATCPTNAGCVPLANGATAVPLSSLSEASGDYWESWFATYTRMVARLQSVEDSSYWHTWFDGYSQAVSRLQATTV